VSICKYCGEEIEFRHVDGQVTPIHLAGGWCSGYGGGSSNTTSNEPFKSYTSYVNPNARCPVCHEQVYFYQSPFGGRVFFDDLGWPWPKHGCTDNPSAQSGKIHRLQQTRSRPFRSAGGERTRAFRLDELVDEGTHVRLKVCELDNPLIVLRLRVAMQDLRDADISLKDLKAAPSFVVRFFETYRMLEFISGRKHKIDGLKVPK
jgi:hypothetical protein